MLGIVKVPNVKGKSLVTGNGKHWIMPATGNYKGEEIGFNEKTAIEIPSILMGLALLYGDKEFKEVVNIIKTSF